MADDPVIPQPYVLTAEDQAIVDKVVSDIDTHKAVTRDDVIAAHRFGIREDESRLELAHRHIEQATRSIAMRKAVLAALGDDGKAFGPGEQRRV